MIDPKLKSFIKKEVARQETTIDLIPSENLASPEILTILGSPLTNKYSEGYPGKRYYPGNEYYDEIELMAERYAIKAFGLNPKQWSVNVQPHSGSPANLAIYSALMDPGDTLMGFALSSGGHLTHGHKVNVSSKFYKTVQYGVDSKTGLIEYKKLAPLAKRHRPKVIVSGATAYPRAIQFSRFKKVAKMVGAYHLADISHISGLVLAGLHPNPFPHSDVVMTTTHKILGGARGAIVFSRKSEIRSTKSPPAPGLRRAGETNPESRNQKPTIAEAIDRAVFPGAQGGPHNNITAAHVQMFYEAMRPEFKRYQKQIVKNANALSKELMRLGFTLVTGGTDNHLILIDVRSADLSGLKAQNLLEKNGIVANRNTVPGDPSPFKPSGIRMGTPLVTRRGMKEKEMKLIAQYIHEVLFEKKNMTSKVKTLCKKFSAKKYLKT